MDLIFTILIILAINVGFFLLGYFLYPKINKKDGLFVTEDNKEAIQEMLAWRNFGGR